MHAKKLMGLLQLPDYCQLSVYCDHENTVNDMHLN